MGGYRGVSGVSGNPLGVSFPPASIHCKLIVAKFLPDVLSASLPMDPNSCRPPDPVQTQLSSIPVQQADAEPPEKQRQIQVMAKGLQLYTLASCSMSATA